MAAPKRAEIPERGDCEDREARELDRGCSAGQDAEKGGLPKRWKRTAIDQEQHRRHIQHLNRLDVAVGAYEQRRFAHGEGQSQRGG